MTPQIEMLISAAVGAVFGVVLATSRGSVAVLFSGVALGIGGELLVGQDFAAYGREVLAEARRLYGPFLLGAAAIHLRAWRDAFAEARRHSAAEAAQQQRQINVVVHHFGRQRTAVPEARLRRRVGRPTHLGPAEPQPRARHSQEPYYAGAYGFGRYQSTKGGFPRRRRPHAHASRVVKVRSAAARCWLMLVCRPGNRRRNSLAPDGGPIAPCGPHGQRRRARWVGEKC